MSNAFSFKVTAESWLVADGDGKIIQSENATEVRAIASITKLMNAIVVLDAELPLEEKIGQFTRLQLLQMSLVHSDNNAAKKLCESYPGGNYACIRDMNRKAQALGMEDTKFVEASGLSHMNVSTGQDLVKLVLAAKEYPLIVEASRTSQIKIKTKKSLLVYNNTNPIIGKRHEDFLVSKTGYNRASGGSIVMMLAKSNEQRIVVVLGSKTTRTRIPEAEFIAAAY